MCKLRTFISCKFPSELSRENPGAESTEYQFHVSLPHVGRRGSGASFIGECLGCIGKARGGMKGAVWSEKEHRHPELLLKELGFFFSYRTYQASQNRIIRNLLNNLLKLLSCNIPF